MSLVHKENGKLPCPTQFMVKKALRLLEAFEVTQDTFVDYCYHADVPQLTLFKHATQSLLDKRQFRNCELHREPLKVVVNL